jgi:hypothetical protein
MLRHEIKRFDLESKLPFTFDPGVLIIEDLNPFEHHANLLSAFGVCRIGPLSASILGEASCAARAPERPGGSGSAVNDLPYREGRVAR